MRNLWILGLVVLCSYLTNGREQNEQHIAKYDLNIKPSSEAFEATLKLTVKDPSMLPIIPTPPTTSTTPSTTTSTTPSTTTTTTPSTTTTTTPSTTTTTTPSTTTTTTPSNTTTTTKLTLTLDTTAISIKECKYQVDEKEQSADCKWDETVTGIVITFEKAIGKSKEVTLTYSGKFFGNGLWSSSGIYIANLKSAELGKVLPYENKDNKVEFQVSGGAEGWHAFSNAKAISGPGTSGSVSLREIVFIVGKFESVAKSEDNKFSTYTTERLKVTPEECKSAQEIVSKLGEYLGAPMAEDHQLITTQSDPAVLNKINVFGLVSQSLMYYQMPEKPTPSMKQTTWTAIAHQLARQWFGSKVESQCSYATEGLSALFSLYAVDEYLTAGKEFKVMDQFVPDHLQLRAFEEDAWPSPKVLSNTMAVSPTYDAVVSDPILYSKGTSLMRTVMKICDKTEFEKNLKKLMTSKIASLDNLIETFKTCFPDKAAESFFPASFEKSGYPVVHIARNNTELSLMQEPFTWGGYAKEEHKWHLPVTYLVGDKQKQIWLSDNQKVTEPADIKWIIVNPGLTGYYRVNYDSKLWDAIIDQLAADHTKFDAITRAQLIDDVFSLARSTRNYTQKTPDYMKALRLSKYLQKETEYIPLKAAFNAFDFLDTALYNTEWHQHFRANVRGIVKKLAEKYSVKSKETSHQHRLIVNEVSSWACRLNISECTNFALEYFQKRFSDKPEISDLEEVLLCSAVRSNAANMKTILDKANPRTFYEGITLLRACGCANDTKELTEFLKRVFKTKEASERGLTYWDFPLEVFASAMEGNPENVKVVLNFIKENFDKLKPNLQSPAWEKIMKMTFRKLSAANANTLSEIAEKLNDSQMKEVVTKVTETAASWKKTKMSSIKEFFSSGGEIARPFALILLLAAIVPLANLIFH